MSTWIKLSARFKTFLKPWQIVYVDTSGKWRSKSSRLNHYHTVFVCARSGFKLTFPHKKAISLSAGLHEIRCSNWQSSAASNLGQGMRDQYKSSIHCCWQKAVNTSVFLQSEHHSLGVPEKIIGDLDRNTRAVMADANIILEL